MLFDDADAYYAPLGDGYYQQGDIVLAPVAVLDGDPGDPGDPGDAADFAVVRRELWDGLEIAGVGHQATANAGLVPAMITTHDCALDKEFNRRYRELRAQQMPMAEALEQAAADDSLDRLLNVAPVVPLSRAAPSAAEQLRRNQVVGFFPVCESAAQFVDEGVVNLLRETTIDRGLIVDRLAILSDDARATLRYALARFWVYRAPGIAVDVELALGKRIVDYRVESSGIWLSYSYWTTIRSYGFCKPLPQVPEVRSGQG